MKLSVKLSKCVNYIESVQFTGFEDEGKYEGGREEGGRREGGGREEGGRGRDGGRRGREGWQGVG